jgi:uncharacterized membrane protein YhfC
LLQGAAMVALPLALWVVAARRGRVGRAAWLVIGVGCLGFVASQVVNTPLRLVAVEAGAAGWSLVAALALISGFGEELMRWLAMRLVPVVRDRLYGPGPLLYGLGHGGVESILVGAAGVLGPAIVLATAADPASLPPPLLVQAETIAAAPPYLFLAGVLERAFAIALHVGLSLIVAAGVMTGSARALLLAMLWHAVANGVALAIADATAGFVGGVFVVEAWVALAAAGALAYGAARVSSARAARAGSEGGSATAGAGSRTGGSGVLGGRS